MSHLRRHFLTTVSCAITGGLAGCQALFGGTENAACDELHTASTTPDLSGADLPVPEENLVRAAAKDQIRAVTDPAFAPDWSDLGERLGRETSQELVPDDLVLGLEREGRARAYPLSVLWTHEIVNDDFAGPVVATYCPVCGSTMVGERTVDGDVTTFGVSGYLWKDDLVMYDERTDSLWSQIAATAIRGPLVGERLTIVPSTLTTWSSWRRDNPGTDVLLPPPLSDAVGEPRRTPYYQSVEGAQIFHDIDPGAVDDRTAVKGVVVNGKPRAYPHPVVRQEQVINDRVNGHPVLVGMGTGYQMVAFDRCVGGTVLRFRNGGDGVALADGSSWQLDTGLALDGPHEGTHLDRLDSPPPMFWFAWRDFHPETDVYEPG